MRKVHAEALALFESKNQCYGDAFAVFGPIGVIVRLGDKIHRLSSITRSGISLVSCESVRDTLIDLHNYAAMAIMLLDESPEKLLEHPRVKELKKVEIADPEELVPLIDRSAGSSSCESESSEAENSSSSDGI
jgi:hypothetical protein